MDIIERYITEVGKYLPQKNRKDIKAELRSTLEDMLDDRAKQAGSPVDEALATELLKEYGSPKKLAATYQTHPYLIGPEIFPIYTLVLKIVIAAVTLGLTIATMIALFGASLTGPEFLKEMGEFAASLITALAAAFGNVTLVFAILERVLPASDFEAELEDWNPAELAREKSISHVSRGEAITSIVVTSAALIILNFYPQIIGIWNMVGGQWVRLVMLSEAFFRLLPWINLSGLLTIALNIWLLRKGSWQSGTRLIDIGLKLFSIGIAIALLRGPDLLTISPDINDAEVALILARIFEAIIPFALLISIIANTIEIAKDILKILRPPKNIFPIEKAS